MKYTLAEKIAGAEKRISATFTAIWQGKRAVKELQKVLELCNSRIEICLGNLAAYADALAYWAEMRQTSERDLAAWLAELPKLKKRLIGQRQYLRKLQAAQAEIDRRFAEEEAEIDLLITLAGALA